MQRLVPGAARGLARLHLRLDRRQLPGAQGRRLHVQDSSNQRRALLRPSKSSPYAAAIASAAFAAATARAASLAAAITTALPTALAPATLAAAQPAAA